MSFDIYVSAFEDEDSYKIPIATLRRRFGKHIKSESGPVWRIGFADEPGESDVYVDIGETTTGFAVGRPPNSLEFWEIIAGILRDLPCALYWPTTDEVAVMGSLDLLRHLPKSFIEKMGIPFVSTDPERIRRYVWENS
ncbi:MAG: hypothetical protein ACT4N4_04995 [Rhodospirillales bacterium]